MGEMSVGRFENKQLEIERVTLWTRQHMSSLNQLKKNGVYRAKKEYIEEYFEDIASYYLMLLVYGTGLKNSSKTCRRAVSHMVFRQRRIYAQTGRGYCGICIGSKEKRDCVF